MSSEEIRAAIDRLALEYGRENMTTFSVTDALVGEYRPKAFGLYDMLVELLEQADPATHMEVPVDADGVPIHVGDRVVEHEDGHDFVVDGYEYDGEWWVFHIDGIRAPVHMCTHYRKPTVEDVLLEMCNEVWEASLVSQTTWSDSGLDGIESKYADKLREVMADE